MCYMPMDILFRDGTLAGIRPKASYLELLERIGFRNEYTLGNCLVIDSL